MTAFSEAITEGFVAIENTEASAGLDLGVYADTPPGSGVNLTEAIATTTNGPATAISAAEVQAGILNSSFLVGRNANFDVSQFGRINSQATSSNGPATATATNGSIATAGGILNTGVNTPGDPDIKVGGNLFSNTLVNNFVTATAGTTNGAATATSNPGNVYGQRNINTQVGGNGEIISTVIGRATNTGPNFGATATTVTGAADATVGVDDAPQVAAIYSSGEGNLNLTMGRDGVISAVAGGPSGTTGVDGPITFVSTATTGTGDATATNDIDLVGGIISDSSPDTGGVNINIGSNTNGGVVNFVRGWGFGDSAAKASTTTGTAEATSTIDVVGGILDRDLVQGKNAGVKNNTSDGSTIFVGGSGSLDGAASATGKAEAYSTSGSPVDATSNANFVVGIGLPGQQAASPGGVPKPGIFIGREGFIQANAGSTQTAIAGNTSGALDPNASAANGDLVAGLLSTDTIIGGNLSRFQGTGRLTATATATATSDASTADAGVGSTSVGVRNSNITVGGSLGATVDNPITKTGTNSNNSSFFATSGSNLTSTATTTTGESTATAGVDAFTAGIDNSDITVGKNGLISSAATSALSSTASTTTGDATATSGMFTSRGITGSNIKIGAGDLTSSPLTPVFPFWTGSGVQASSTVDASSSATAGGGGGKADATTDVDSVGIDLAPDGNSIQIGKQGFVSGSSLVTGGSTATSNGSATADAATATANIGSTGLLMGLGSSVKIGEAGSISGSGFVGAGVNDPFVVSATSNRGPATANATFSPVVGIDANAKGATLQAGVLGGSVFGDAGISADISATSTNNDALVNDTGSTVTGILLGAGNSIQAGLATPSNPAFTSSVQGNGTGIFDVSATSINGKADATNTASVYGINMAPTASIKVGGFNDPAGTGYLSSANPTVLATAFLSNTVTATSTNGAATAKAGGSAIGLSGGSVDILGSGTIVASATGTVKAISDGNGL